MLGFRLSDQTPPDAHRVTDVAISRYEHVFEVDPALMEANVPQQAMPEWDFKRIVDDRLEHLAWMHDHWALSIVSGQELLDELDTED